MKWIRTKRGAALLTAGIFMVFALVLNLAGALAGNKHISITEAVAQANRYEIRSLLLTEAMDAVGVCRPEDAATVWAEGLKRRSGAYQYAVLGKKLRAQFSASWEKNYPNWVTGLSSPWVESYEIVSRTEIGKSLYLYELKLSLATSAGPAGSYPALLTLSMENGFWRIIALTVDPALNPYIGLAED